MVLMCAVLAVSVLGACSTATKKKLGLVSEGPDEFMVMSRAPLSLPPDYDLRPVNDMSALNEIDMTERLSGMDLSEQKLMSKIEAQNTDDDIKAKIEREFKELNANSYKLSGLGLFLLLCSRRPFRRCQNF